MALFRVGQGRGLRLKGVDILEADHNAAPRRLTRQVGLAMVEIEHRIGGHDHVVSGLRCDRRAIRSMPGGDRGFRRQAARQDVVPSHHTAAMRLQELLDPLGEAALQRVLVGQSFGLDPGLDGGGRSPLVLHRLVAANGDVGAWEERHHLGEDVLQERQGRVVVAIDVGKYPPVALHLSRRRAARRELWVGQHGGQGMPRHLDLRHDGHAARLGVGHQRPRLGLGVEAAISGAGPGARRDAPGADLGQLRIFADLQTPGLVVREVPLQDVELVQRHPVDQALDETD